MQETRRQRLASVVQQELSLVISRELKDPRIPTITVTAVEVTPEGEQATCFISILGSDLLPAEQRVKQMKDCLEGLKSASGFLRRHLASILTTRHIPAVIFKEDRGLENSTRIFDLLKEIGPMSPDVPAEPESESVAEPSPNKWGKK
jgi:ribosome-binding factor A